MDEHGLGMQYPIGRKPIPHVDGCKEYTLEIKWGMGQIRDVRHYHGWRNIRLFHVVINGHTLFSDISEEVAKAWAYDYMKKNPTKTHHFV